MFRRLLAGVVVVVGACRPAPTGSATPVPAERPTRPAVPPAPPAPPVAPAELGDDVAPTAYRLELELDPAARGFRGAIEIDVAIARPTRAIWFHAAPELALTPIAVTRAGAAVAHAGVVRGVGSIAGVALVERLAPGPATVRLEFAGDYRDREGLFAQSEGGERFVYTDFEPVDARRAFPCFDLPRWRAPWSVTVRTPDGMQAYANMPEDTQTREGDRLVHKFAPTPPLPSYLVAVAVGRFTEVAVPDAPIPARVLVPGGGDVAMAASLVGPILAATARTIDRAIPWPKLDLVVVPQMSGAMENPGLVTVAARLAVAPRGLDARRLLALVVAHEIAHLWFGDAVTVASWRELWLNEGLATWLADRVLGTMQPPWRDPIDRVNDRLDVFADDGVAGVHPLRPATIATPRALFDRLSYDKGAAVIHTLDAWLGREPVRAALAAHLDRHAWSSAASEDLIASLAAIDGGAPIAAVVADAIANPGVPTVAAEVDCGAAGATLRVQAVGPPRRLAVCARWSGGRGCVVTGASPAPIALGPRCPDWIVPDDDGVGYYRWQLPARWWAALAAAPLTPAERRAALDSTMVAVGAGQLALGPAVAIVAAAIATGEYRLVEPAGRAARQLLAVAPPAERAALAKAIAAGAERALAVVGRTPVANDDPARARARAGALELAGVIGGDRRAVRWADRATAAWLRGAPQTDEVTGPALAITAARGTPRRRRALLEAARRGAGPAAADAELLGRALATLPDATVAPLLVPPAGAPRVAAWTALVGALLEDPRRAAPTVAALADLPAPFLLFATGWPCAMPAGEIGIRDPDTAAALDRARDRLAVIAAQCQALAARFPPP